ncbi:hypothetical protein DFA_01725 [Cavenderia fasciculata]|uniref:Transmembrane protein n=1 Tax=Cavenderia fasciculata TaxID=261658 RepID=F4PUC4_CACFS|nr:uncharacterized protein DFA_01725 [Cavenderia fasciculata]EGG21839.1 hypothetical protein DFA_01725 [Cavenderia fasciculata]|eukprot:XP_004359689.1 hypothetical protein DFA_01725 [Cavenderia fasciculata]
MNKLITIIVAVLAIIALAQSATINSIVQNDHTLLISTTPQNMIWVEAQLKYGGLITNILPYCKQPFGLPINCTLPAVPSCDNIRLYATVIGMGSMELTKDFTCTVTAP